MYSPSILIVTVLATVPVSCTTYNNTEGVPATQQICDEVTVEIKDAVAGGYLEPTVGNQVISNCLANL